MTSIPGKVDWVNDVCLSVLLSGKCSSVSFYISRFSQEYIVGRSKTLVTFFEAKKKKKKIVIVHVSMIDILITVLVLPNV